ncbi:hypothetical protein DFH09DRAFT_490905 [Mycena vulgaris]|nr:hypothetical protein DFH09DRAFT_490905 [Mycena vulgaris]
MISCSSRTFLAACALAYLEGCISAVLNRTIDNFKGDLTTGFVPIYEPQHSWNTVVDGNCTLCSVKPDPTRTVDNTWHDSSQRAGDSPSSVTIQFTGTAIYLFCIVPQDDPTNLVNLTFTVDGASTGATPISQFLREIFNIPSLCLQRTDSATNRTR